MTAPTHADIARACAEHIMAHIEAAKAVHQSDIEAEVRKALVAITTYSTPTPPSAGFVIFSGTTTPPTYAHTVWTQPGTTDWAWSRHPSTRAEVPDAATDGPAP